MTTARASKKPAKPTKRNGKPKPTKDVSPANGSATTLVTDEPARQRKPPVPYSEEIGDIICERLRNGETLTGICKAEGMPDESTVRQWAANLDHDFYPQYARARELGYHKMADDLLEIANGIEQVASKADAATANAQVQRDRLKVDTRKWLLSKALPKIYGDRLEVDAKAGLVVVETPAAIKALLEALPDLGVLQLTGSAIPAISSDGEEVS